MIYYEQKRSGPIRDEGLGLIHIYYGSGVGKTTRSVGLAVRAAGNDFQVDYVQFMKSGDTGEAVMLEKMPNVRYYCPGHHPFIMSKGPDRVHYEHAEKALAYAIRAVDGGTQVLVCDEILDTLLFKLLEEDQLMELMKKCRKRAELVMTGRTAPRDFFHMADYVAEMIQIKHPYYTGAIARRGIEY